MSTRQYLKDIKINNLNPYSDEKTSISSDNLHEEIEKLINFFDKTGIKYNNYQINGSSLDFVSKKAYPNIEDYMSVPGQHNTQKWLQAISDIYRREKGGEPRVKAIRAIVNGWNIMETFDFLNWVKFYESGDHMKYKFAQLWYENDALGPGYFLQVKKDSNPVPESSVTGQDIQKAQIDANTEIERRQTIERQRSKIIGRLDSAEKLLRSPDGHTFSGKEFESLLEAIYQLKKKIHMVNKVSSSIRLYEDMIIREANILSKNGFIKAAETLYSLAQTPAAAGEKANGDPNASLMLPPPASPTSPTGAGNPGVPSGGAATPAQPPGNSNTPQSPPNETQPKGISEFLSRMDDGKYSPEDKQVADDLLEVEDSLEVSDMEEILVTEAQISPEEITTTPSPAPLNPSKVSPPKLPINKEKPEGKSEVNGNLEVTEDDIKSTPKSQNHPTSNFDSKVDAILADVTVADVVIKLEDLAKIFKTREVPRQLGIVDMMLDSLGLASYFPSLSEATNKALESNNYISTRVEDILSKLRGAMTTNEVDLKGKENNRPDVAGVKNKLQEESDKDKARKQMRKEQEIADLTNSQKETPEIEINEDLAPESPQGNPAITK